MSRSSIIHDLVIHQRENVENDRLGYNDIIRLSKSINGDIFGDKCVVWQNTKIRDNRKTYPTFYLNKRKCSLNRVLYSNYINKIVRGEYIYTKCNTIKCICMSHIIKHTPKRKVIEEPLIKPPFTEEDLIINFD